MRRIFALVLVVLTFPASAQQCPAGTYPWKDQWGNSICKRFEGGGAATIEKGAGGACPAGTQSWVDQWGNRVCQTIGGNQRFYGTANGCPIGTVPGRDGWGNAVCRRL